MTGAARAICHDLTTMLNAVSVNSSIITALGVCTALDLCKSDGAAITAKVAFDVAAVGDVVVRAYSSPAGTVYDTPGHEYTEMRIVCNPNNTEQGTMRIGAEVGLVKVTVENEGAVGPPHLPATVTVTGQKKVGDDTEV